MTPALENAQKVASFVLQRLETQFPSMWKQAPRSQRLIDDDFPAELEIFNRHVLFRVPQDASLGLLEWARGKHHGVLWTTMPSWRDILKAQAIGQRPVTMSNTLPVSALEVAGIPKKYELQDVGLAFALHDLRHLLKFFEPTHHESQRSFFQALDSAIDSPLFEEAAHDAPDAFHLGIQRIASDMNGAAPFLLMALKALVLENFHDGSETRRLHCLGRALKFTGAQWALWNVQLAHDA